MKAPTYRPEFLLSRLVNESHSLGGFEQRLGFLEDSLRACDIMVTHFANRLYRLSKKPSRTSPEALAVLRESVALNKRSRKNYVKESNMLRREIDAARLEIASLRERLESQLR